MTGFDPRWSLLDLTAAYGYLVYGAVAIEEVYAEAAKDFPAVALSNMIQGGLNAAVVAASSTEMLEDPSQEDFEASVLFTIAQVLPTFVNFYVYCAWKWSPALWDAWQDGLGDSVWITLGAMNLEFCPAYAIWYPDDYLGKNGVTLISNLGTSLPYFTPIMPSPNWSAVLTGAGYAIGIGTSIAAAFEE